MTYPPQQPGPGGWGQQPQTNAPAQNQQQGPPQQQPAWYGNQHATWGAGQPGQPGPAPFAQPGPPPQGQPGQRQQPPPPPNWGGGEFGQSSWILEANGFGEVEPPKKKSKLPWIFGIVGALVVAGGGATALFLFLNSGPGEPKPVAQEMVGKVNAGNFTAIGDELCQSNRSQLQNQLDQLKAYDFDLKLGRVTENGDKATAQLSGTYSTEGTSKPVDQSLAMVVENGQWKICRFDQ